MIIKAINIKWDVVDSAEDMAESEIKEIYGFCHYGFDTTD